MELVLVFIIIEEFLDMFVTNLKGQNYLQTIFLLLSFYVQNEISKNPFIVLKQPINKPPACIIYTPY